MQTISVKLPKAIYQQLARAAKATHQPVENVLLRSVSGNLPPALDDVPARWRASFEPLLSLSSEDLTAVAQSQRPVREWKRHVELLRMNKDSTLSAAENAELAELAEHAELHATRCAFVVALLRWHGQNPVLASPALADYAWT